MAKKSSILIRLENLERKHAKLSRSHSLLKARVAREIEITTTGTGASIDVPTQAVKNVHDFGETYVAVGKGFQGEEEALAKEAENLAKAN